MKGPLLLGGWVVTLAVAFFLGRGLGGGAPTTDVASADVDATRIAELERRNEELNRKLAEERSRRPRGETARERDRSAAGDAQTDSAAVAAGDAVPAAAAAAPEAFSLEGATSAPEISKRLMAFVDAQLARGPKGHAAILEALNAMWRDRKTLEGFFNDETALSREVYPWVKFLVQREEKMLDLSEYVFQTMAERPEAFADTPNKDVLEIFTEGVGFLLPGAVPEDRMARFRQYAAKILETPAARQPEAVRNNRSDIERLLARFWAAPLTAEEALAKLRAGGVQARDLGRLLRQVPAEALAGIDLTGLVAPMLREGNYDVVRILGTPPLDRLDVARLDQAVHEVMESGKTNSGFVSQYLQRTGRKQWSDLRPFVDRALTGGDASKTVALQVIATTLPPNLRPDRAYVEDLLQRGVVPEGMTNQVRGAYGIK